MCAVSLYLYLVAVAVAVSVSIRTTISLSDLSTAVCIVWHRQRPKPILRTRYENYIRRNILPARQATTTKRRSVHLSIYGIYYMYICIYICLTVCISVGDISFDGFWHKYELEFRAAKLAAARGAYQASSQPKMSHRSIVDWIGSHDGDWRPLGRSQSTQTHWVWAWDRDRDRDWA